MKKIKARFFSVGITGAFDAKVARENFKAAARSFRSLARSCGFKPVVCDKILCNRRELIEFFNRCTAENVSMFVLHTASFTAGEMGQQAAWHALEHPAPFVIWGVPEPTGGPLTVNNLCCTNFMTSIFHSMGAPYKWIWGKPGSDDVNKELAATASAARTITALQNALILVVGSARVPGFYGSNFDETAIKSRYGVHLERIPLSEFYSEYEAVTQQRTGTAVAKIRKINAHCSADDDEVERAGRAYAALRKLARERGAAGLAVRCWPEMRDDLGIDACLPMALLGEDGIPCSCEADVPGLLTMILQHELTARAAGPPTLLDMVSISEKTNSVGLWHCGVAPPSLAEGRTTICRHNIVEQGNPEAKMGLVLESAMKPGPATICRLQGDAADRYIAASGRVLKQPPAFRGSFAEFKPESITAPNLLSTIMSQGITHHYSIAYTDHLSLIEEAAYWLNIERVEQVPANGQSAGFGSL